MDKKQRPLPDPSTEPVQGEPVDAWDQMNKYGTYEVQDTTNTDNVFPTIGCSWKACLDLPEIPPAKPE